MFELTKTNCKSASTSKNSENMGAGGETRQGVSLYFEFDANNETLDMLDPKLRSSFYERAANDAQEDMTDHMPVRKFELKKPLEWPWVGMGYKVILHADLDFSADFELSDCKIDNIQLTPKNDGIVGWRYRVYCHPELKDIGPILAIEKHNVAVTLVPPSAEYVAPVPEKKRGKKKEVTASNDSQGELPIDPLYEKAKAVVCATKNPSSQALMTELKIPIATAAAYLTKMIDEGVIRLEGDEYVVVEKKEEAA